MPQVEGNLKDIRSITLSRGSKLVNVGIDGEYSALLASLETSPIIRALPLGILQDQKESLRVSNWQRSDR